MSPFMCTGRSMFMCAIVATTIASVTTSLCNAQVTISLDPKRTFLRTSSFDPVNGTIPLELGALGFAPGDRIQLHRLGDWDNGPGSDQFNFMIAVFSSSAELLPSNQQHRVPGAITAGVPLVTGTTHFEALPTDIPEDFGVSYPTIPDGTICVVIPSDATHIFVATLDSHYSDNADPNLDWAVELSLLDECAADLDANGTVDGADLAMVLGHWGQQPYSGAPGDVDCNGSVDGVDLAVILGSWGPCR